MRTYFSFGLNAPVYLLIILIAVWAVLTYYYYRRIKQVLTKPLFIFLWINRTVIFALLLICLWQPRIVTEYEEKLKNAFIFVVSDNSRSMSILDGSLKAATSRISDVNTLLKEQSSFRKALNEKISPERQKFYEFSDRTKKISEPGKAEASGNKTDFKELVKKISSDSTGLPSAGIVLFSDGNDTAGSDIAGLARELKAKNLPVYAVGIGGGKSFKDVEITSLTGPEEALEKTIIGLRAMIKYTGEPVRRLPIILKESGKVLETRYLDFDGKNSATLAFNTQAGGFGVKSYSVEVSPLNGELFKENNQDSWNVTVKKAPAIKALFICHKMDYDFMFIKGAADELKIKYAAALRTSPNIYLRQVLPGFDDLKKGFPGSKEELNKYNVLILCNVDFSLFSSNQLEWMAEFVKENKGGLLVFGENTNPAKAGALEKILPVELGPFLFKNTEKPYQFLVTPEGKRHSLFGTNGNIETALTPELRNIETHVEVKGIKAGATVLANVIDSEKKESPFMVAEQVGGGKVLFFAGGDFWRWKMLSDPSAKLFENFWRNAMVWLAVSNVKQEGITIFTDKSKYTEGDTAVLNAECINADGEKIKNVRLKGYIETTSGKKENITFSATDEGEYSARIRLKDAGVTKIAVEGVLAAAVDKETASILVSVKTGDEEFKSLSLNESALKRLASLSGGDYTPVDKTDGIFKKIEKGAETQIKKTVSRDLWDNLWILGLILLLFSAELIIRKNKSLF